jgi:hypothetical protein
LNAAFIHELRPENSTWVQGHERGRLYLQDTLGEQVTTQVYYGVGNGEEAEQAMEKVIENGAEVIFATTAPLIAACRKTAAKYPNVKILNCSISMPYTGVRTYYSRIYEGKFISGAIAGAVSKSDRIGYIASSPIFGVPAGIKVVADENLRAEGFKNIFVGGDCQTGPKSAIMAIGAGKVAARNIDEYLGFHHKLDPEVEVPKARPNVREAYGRVNIVERPARERGRDFDHIEIPLCEEEVMQECSRCLRCDAFGCGVLEGGRVQYV